MRRADLLRRLATPSLVLGSLSVALALAAVSDRPARANEADPRDHARAKEPMPNRLRVLDWTLWIVAKYYVDPNRVDPDRIMLQALEGLENAIAEVLVEPMDEGTVRVRVGTASMEVDARVSGLWDVGPRMREVFRFITEHTQLDEREQREAEYAVIENLLRTLDPHTNLLRPDAFEEMTTQTKGSFGGLGIEVSTRDGELTVIRVLEGTPAAEEGMEAGDKIVQIGDESTVAMSVGDAVQLLKGPPGTTVTIRVAREGLSSPKKIVITRAIIQLDSVTADILPGVDERGERVDIGLVQIPRNFARSTGKELRAKLREFEEADVRGVILDMRDNQGGLFQAAVEVADAFLASGPIVSTVGGAEAAETSFASTDYDFPDVPLIVLVDQGSASATEIVAGALRNLDRGLIVGRRTFGKGSVQILHDRRAGDRELGFKVTIAQYLTPGNISIQSVGISPDLETVPVWVGERHVSYYGRKRFDLVREEAYAQHLDHETAKQQVITWGPLHYLQEGSLGDDALDSELDRQNAAVENTTTRAQILLRDPEIRLARDLVVWAPSNDRQVMLENLPSFAEKRAALEDERIRLSLGNRDVDWSLGAKPTTGEAALEVQIEMDAPDNIIEGGSSGELTVTVTNSGTADAYRVRAISDSDYGYFDERELVFGRIPPGESRQAKLRLSVAAHELSRSDRIDFAFSEQFGAAVTESSTTSVDVGAKGVKRPKFGYGWQVIDDPAAGENIVGNGDGLLQIGERVRLRIWVKDDGEGDALDTWVRLRNSSGDALFMHSGRARIGKLAPGESSEVSLDFEVRKPPSGSRARVQVTVSDAKVGETLTDTITIPVIVAGTEFDKVDGTAKAQDALEIQASPLDSARVIARAPRGAVLRTTGARGEWQRLDLGSGRLGFVKRPTVSVSDGAPSRVDIVEDAYTVTPPRITLDPPPTRIDGESVRISGVAKDGEQVRDLYVTVYNPSRNLFGRAEKVYYLASDDPSEGALRFEADIPLTPGNNIIEIYARENDQVTGVERLWVLRTSGLAEARAAEKK